LAPGKLAHSNIAEHFAALLVGIPMSALIAMCVVILLRFSAEPIEFEGLSFEFRGASGQVVFWVFCFLALSSAALFKKLSIKFSENPAISSGIHRLPILSAELE
jgi:uncharacterized membrane protein YjgN (DUF898 family)